MLMDGKSVEEIMEFTDKADAMRKANPFAKIDAEAVMAEIKKEHEKQAEATVVTTIDGNSSSDDNKDDVNSDK